MKRGRPEIAEPNAERAISLVTAEYRMSREKLLGTDRDHRTTLVRAIAMTLCYRGGMKQKRIAELFGGKSLDRVHKSIARIERRCMMSPHYIERMAPVIRDLYFFDGDQL